jgi:spermidine synthase
MYSPYLGSPIWYIFLGMIPFIFGGGIISYIFRIQPNTYQVYLIDLMGGIIGLITAIFLMNYLGTIQAIIISYLLVALILVILKSNKINIIITLVVLAALLLGFGNIVSFYQNNFNSFKTTPYVHFEENSEIKFSHWDAFAKTDAVWTKERPNEMMIGLNGRSFSRMIKYNGDLSQIKYLKNKIGYLPFVVGSPDKVAMIGSGGGEEILYSFLAGIKNITAIEINQSTVTATRKLAEFSGNIYNDPRVETIIGDGRSYIRETDQKFDQIYLALVMTNIGDNVANTLSENYIYTEEALQNYFAKLRSGGKLSFLFHSQNDMLKLLTTAITNFENSGIEREQIPEHFVIIKNKHSGMNPVLMLKPTPFTSREITNITRKVKQKGFEAVHLPGLKEYPLLQLYKKGKVNIKDMVKGIPVNIAPISDDKPFFYNSKKGLPRSLVVLVLGTFFVLIVALLFAKYNNIIKKDNFSFIYNFIIFVLLGTAFMLIEITLIQKMSVFLEHPTTSFVTIITVLLLGAGIGNFMQMKKQIFNGFKPVLYLVILGLAEIFLLNKVIYWQGINSLGYKIILTSVLLLPLGFLMGIPFPMILNKLRENKQQNLIPYFWGVNGISSVLGSGLALIISLKYGFTLSFIIGVILYSIVGISIKKVIE